MKPRWSLFLILGGIVLSMLTVVPQCASRRFDRGGLSQSNTGAYYAVPRAEGLFVTSADDSAVWIAALEEENGNLYDVGAAWDVTTTGLWMKLIERESLTLTPETMLKDRGLLPELEPVVLRRATAEFVERQPNEAAGWLRGQVSAVRLIQLLSGDVSRIIWVNLGLMMLQVSMVLGGLILVRRGWRELRDWNSTAHQRCAHCGYSIVGLESTTHCPECGEGWRSYQTPVSRGPQPTMFPPIRHRATAMLLIGVLSFSLTYAAQRFGERYLVGSRVKSGFSGLYAVVDSNGIDLRPSQGGLPTPDSSTDVYSVGSEWRREGTRLWQQISVEMSWKVNAEPIAVANYRPPAINNAALQEALRQFVLQNPDIALRLFTGESIPADQLLAILNGASTRFVWPAIGLMCAQAVLLVLGFVLVARGLLGYRFWYLTSHHRCVRCGCPTVGLTEADRCPECREPWSVSRY